MIKELQQEVGAYRGEIRSRDEDKAAAALDRAEDLETDVQNLEEQLRKVQADRRKSEAELRDARREKREAEGKHWQASTELTEMQANYERELSRLQEEKAEADLTWRATVDDVQAEVEYLRSQLDHGKGGRPGAASDPEHAKLDQIVARAQASISKVMRSPLGRRGDLLQTPGSKNDSLDAMRNDFMNDYRDVIQQSGETFFKPDHPALSAQKDNQIGGALRQMVAAGRQLTDQEAAELQI